MCKTIKQKVKFKAPPLAVYELLTDEKMHRAFTGKSAFIDQTVGGRFSTYSGSITGVIVNLLPGKRIVQAWQERNFPSGVFSMVTFQLVPTAKGGTELTLTHRGVPKELIPRIESEWRTRYWDKMKEFLSTNSNV
jgi:uncharacterized protein YndB with AHSA1/START domain